MQKHLLRFLFLPYKCAKKKDFFVNQNNFGIFTFKIGPDIKNCSQHIIFNFYHKNLQKFFYNWHLQKITMMKRTCLPQANYLACDRGEFYKNIYKILLWKFLVAEGDKLYTKSAPPENHSTKSPPYMGFSLFLGYCKCKMGLIY